MNAPTVNQVSAEEFAAFARTCPTFGYQQSPAYVERLAARDRARAEFVTVERDGAPIGGAALRRRSIPVIGGGYAYIAAGPIVRRDEDYACVVEALRDHYAGEHRTTLRILAPIGTESFNEQAASAFEAAGFDASDGRGYRTLLVDLEGTADDLLANCSKYWRRNLRRSEKNELTVTEGTGREMIEALIPLQATVMIRKSCAIDLDASFYAELQDDFDEPERLQVVHVSDESGLLAGIATSTIGRTAVPVILAATDRGRKLYASYLAQWTSIMQALDRGCTQYDLGGIDPDGNAGVHDFKRGLRGTDVTAAGPCESIGSAARHLVMRQAASLRRKAA